MIHLAAGLVAGLLVVAFGALRERYVIRFGSLLLGTLLVWGALVAGVTRGFEAWQQSPEAPDDAFSDGGPMLGALFLGWIPASLVCVLAYGLVRWRRRTPSRGLAQ